MKKLKVIISSENALNVDNIKDCVCELAKAKKLLFGMFSKYLPEVDSNLREADRFFETKYRFSPKFFSYLSQYLNNLRNINFVALCGVSMKDYLLMEQYLPYAYQTADQKWHYNLKYTQPSKEIALKISLILINLSIKLNQLIF